MKKYFLFLLCFLLLYSTVFAARPLDTDDSGTADPNKYTVELGYDGTRDQQTTYTTTIITGINDIMDFSLGVPFATVTTASGNNQSGLSDITLKTKFKLFEDADKNPALSLSLETKLNNGDVAKGLGTGTTDWTAGAIVTKDLSFLTLHLNYKYTLSYMPNSADPTKADYYSAAIEKGLTDTITFLAELTQSRDLEPAFTQYPTGALVGFNWQYNDAVLFDIGIATTDTGLGQIDRSVFGCSIDL